MPEPLSSEFSPAQKPYELRWTDIEPEPFEVMHLYLGLRLFNRAIKDVLDEHLVAMELRDVSGGKDAGAAAREGWRSWPFGELQAG